MNILGICSRITQLPHLLGGDIHGFHSFMSGNTKKKHIHLFPGKPWVYTTQKWDSQVSTKYHGSSRPSRSCFHQGRKHSDFPINHCSCLHLALVPLLTPVSPPPHISLLCAHEELCNPWSRGSSPQHSTGSTSPGGCVSLSVTQTDTAGPYQQPPQVRFSFCFCKKAVKCSCSYCGVTRQGLRSAAAFCTSIPVSSNHTISPLSVQPLCHYSSNKSWYTQEPAVNAQERLLPVLFSDCSCLVLYIWRAQEDTQGTAVLISN